PDSPGDTSQQHENQGRPLYRALRPEAKPYQLSAGPMFFSRGEQSDSTEQAPTHFEIPTVIITPPAARSAFGPQRLFNRLQPRQRALPLLTPQLQGPRPGPGPSPRTPPPPGGQTRAPASTQPCQGLHQMQYSGKPP